MFDKIKLNNKLLDLVPVSEALDSLINYNDRSYAIEKNGTAYPVLNINTMNPVYDGASVYIYNAGSVFNEPAPQRALEYDASNNISFSKNDDIKDLIQKQYELKKVEREILTNPDNIFQPIIDENTNTAEMIALKEAVIAKKIDIDKYESRFGPNFNNDKRLFNKDSITMNKLKSICNALDIKVTLTLSDADGDIANPIGHSISVELNTDANEEE